MGWGWAGVGGWGVVGLGLGSGQEPHFFRGTVAENIAWGLSSFDFAEVQEAFGGSVAGEKRGGGGLPLKGASDGFVFLLFSLRSHKTSFKNRKTREQSGKL